MRQIITLNLLHKNVSHVANRALIYVLVLVLLFPGLLVFFWMATSSLKQQVDIYSIPPLWLNFKPTLDNYFRAFQTTPFGLYLMNSSVVAIGSTLIGLVIGVPAAYSIARYHQSRLSLMLLTARLMPGVAYLVPFFIMFLWLKMIGSYQALILSHLVVTFPLTVYILIGFYEDLPGELIDAAYIDGCSRFGAFFRIALPLTLPGVITAGVLSFIYSWNDFKMALILSNSSTRTLPVAVFNFMNEAYMDWGGMMAYSTIIVIPILILTIFLQRYIVTGLTMGGIK